LQYFYYFFALIAYD